MLMLALIAEGKVESRQRGHHNARRAPRKSTEPAIQPQALRLPSTNGRMAVLSFSLTPEATGGVYEALVCLAKFGESVAIEARGDKVRLEDSRVYTRDLTDTRIVHADRTESVQDGLCFIRT